MTQPCRHTPGRESTLGLALFLAVAAIALSACDAGSRVKSTQVAAKVNREEITVHQINHQLQTQRGLRPDEVEAAERLILDRLIDQELAVQKAHELQLDRNPDVVQQVEAAKRAVIAQAYADRLAASAAKPTEADARRYFDSHPNLFRERKIFIFQELSIEAKPGQQAGDLRAKFDSLKSQSEFIDYLEGAGHRHSTSQFVRGAEQLPLDQLERVAAMRPGNSTVVQTPTGARVLTLVSSRPAPLSFEQARSAIERYLLNEQMRLVIAEDSKSLRKNAEIVYLGRYAAAVDTRRSAPAAPSPPASPLNTGVLDAATIIKGLGI